MQKHLAGLLAALLVVGWAGAARADDAATQKDLQAQYDRAAKAYRAEKLADLMALFTADYTSKGVDGKVMNRAEAEENFKQQFAAVKSVKEMIFKIDKLAVDGDQATVNSSLRFTAILPDEQGKDHTLVL